MKRRSLIAVGVLSLCGVGALLALPERWSALAEPQGTILEGAFQIGGASRDAVWEDARNRRRPTFGTGLLGGAELGSFRSNPFPAPPRLRCYLAGFPRTAGIRIYLKDEENKRELPLISTIDPSFVWQERVWKLPPEWQGRPVRFAIEDNSADPNYGWIGATLPEAGTHSSLLPFARAAYRSVFLVLEFAWFLIPGVAIALFFRPAGAVQFAAAALIAAALAGYCVFWIYLASPKAGVLASGVLLAAASAAILLRRAHFRPEWLPELRALFLAVALTAVFYHSLGFLYYTEDGPAELAQLRFLPERLPPDNMLQYLFAADIYQGKSVRPFLIANVHASERPPLVTALTLEQWPFWRLLSILHSYQLLGLVLQCLWVAALWILLRRCGIRLSAVIPVFFLTLFSGFTWQHSFFVWPKLLAAAFCLIGMASVPMIRNSRQSWTLNAVLIATAAFTMSLLSHTGSGFTILAVCVLLAARNRLPPLRYSAAAALLALSLVLPWRAYQVWADPPSDALFKLHLAGIVDGNLSITEALARGYGSLTVPQLLSNKFRNVEVLFAAPSLPGTGFLSTVRNFVQRSFYEFFPCAGLLNLGLLARCRLRRETAVTHCADRLLAVSLLSLALWCLLMFEPGSTVVHQGSFATVLLYFAAMSLYLHAWSPFWTRVLILVQATAVFPAFVFLVPMLRWSGPGVANGELDFGMAAAALVSLALLLAGAVYVHKRGEAL